MPTKEKPETMRNKRAAVCSAKRLMFGIQTTAIPTYLATRGSGHTPRAEGRPRPPLISSLDSKKLQSSDRCRESDPLAAGIACRANVAAVLLPEHTVLGVHNIPGPSLGHPPIWAPTLYS